MGVSDVSTHPYIAGVRVWNLGSYSWKCCLLWPGFWVGFYDMLAIKLPWASVASSVQVSFNPTCLPYLTGPMLGWIVIVYVKQFFNSVLQTLLYLIGDTKFHTLGDVEGIEKCKLVKLLFYSKCIPMGWKFWYLMQIINLLIYFF